jgi:hypothetical protein
VWGEIKEGKYMRGNTWGERGNEKGKQKEGERRNEKEGETRREEMRKKAYLVRVCLLSALLSLHRTYYGVSEEKENIGKRRKRKGQIEGKLRGYTERGNWEGKLRGGN